LYVLDCQAQNGEEIWYFNCGTGEMWRKQEGREEVVERARLGRGARKRCGSRDGGLHPPDVIQESDQNLT
jgi:hypothetical protein